jgi:hypothetical protein
MYALLELHIWQIYLRGTRISRGHASLADIYLLQVGIPRRHLYRHTFLAGTYLFQAYISRWHASLSSVLLFYVYLFDLGEEGSLTKRLDWRPWGSPRGRLWRIAIYITAAAHIAQLVARIFDTCLEMTQRTVLTTSWRELGQASIE